MFFGERLRSCLFHKYILQFIIELKNDFMKDTEKKHFICPMKCEGEKVYDKPLLSVGSFVQRMAPAYVVAKSKAPALHI
jgi:hypothetical protein